MANRKVKFTTNVGEFVVEMFEDKAPKTTKNFIDLTEKGYYNGLIFHRVIDGFMIQGGCPNVRFEDPKNLEKEPVILGMPGTGGPGYKIEDEFGEGLKHESEGILSMANAGPNTGGSQFFITLAATPWLDGKHAIFGKVIEGMEVVREIGHIPTGPRDMPQYIILMEKLEVMD